MISIMTQDTMEKAAALFAENGDDEHAAELKQRIAAL